ncbi:hypothetical protein SteCoe_16937 [Stentor coeruleus]|uniref:Uncharacterized protein n=1 Tax=Stentor coeruleus TaxID=5963 RepID=A0A1R2C039_9CILI|nr:hypothetical protein SteCoe_16937 [Stentor coeruleus]
MAEIDPMKNLGSGPSKYSTTHEPHAHSQKSAEYLSINYTIEKISGLRAGKRSNSFRAGTSANLKSIIHTVIKKIKFSTRYKYAVLYYDTSTNSNPYIEWRKLKDKSDISIANSIKIRVCRYKITPPKPTTEPVQVAVPTLAPQQAPMGSMPTYTGFNPFNPGFMAFYMAYLNYMQYHRMQSFMQ